MVLNNIWGLINQLYYSNHEREKSIIQYSEIRETRLDPCHLVLSCCTCAYEMMFWDISKLFAQHVAIDDQAFLNLEWWLRGCPFAHTIGCQNVHMDIWPRLKYATRICIIINATYECVFISHVIISVHLWAHIPCPSERPSFLSFSFFVGGCSKYFWS